jgi:hypothetical protein
MISNTGINNERVYPKTERRGKSISLIDKYETTPMDRIKALSKPQKLIVKELHREAMTKNPENRNGNSLLREQFNLP